MYLNFYSHLQDLNSTLFQFNQIKLREIKTPKQKKILIDMEGPIG